MRKRIEASNRFDTNERRIGAERSAGDRIRRSGHVGQEGRQDEGATVSAALDPAQA
jgi:hypothetical protein